MKNIVFQLHTVHQERWYSLKSSGRNAPTVFQLHTVHQEHMLLTHKQAYNLLSFNSTRYIRNSSYINQICGAEKLSTPHGTLGTSVFSEMTKAQIHFQLHTVHQEHLMRMVKESLSQTFQLHTVHQERVSPISLLSFLLPFNSTRYIRNFSARLFSMFKMFLSTPHGTLGTLGCVLNHQKNYVFQLHTVHQEPIGWRNERIEIFRNFQLHTVHQERLFWVYHILQCVTFNSTRYIRNMIPSKKKLHNKAAFNSTRYIRNNGQTRNKSHKSLLSTPHGTLGTQIGTDENFVHLSNFQLHTVHQEQLIITRRIRQINSAFNSTRYIRNPKRPH